MIPFRRPRRALVPRTNPHASDRGLTSFASGLSGQSHGLCRAQSRWCLPIPRCRASAAPEQLSICPVLALSTNRLTLTYSMRTRLLGRLPQLTALGALITRRSRGWRRWQAARLAEATADGCGRSLMRSDGVGGESAGAGRVSAVGRVQRVPPPFYALIVGSADHLAVRALDGSLTSTNLGDPWPCRAGTSRQEDRDSRTTVTRRPPL